jgi:hypothetical protein
MELTFSRQFLASIARMIPEMAPGGPGQSGPHVAAAASARGWGYAEYAPTSVQPDNGAGLTQGIIGLANKASRAHSTTGEHCVHGRGAPAAPSITLRPTPQSMRNRSASTGHSRYGKAALVAMAYDPRFAIGYISSSGEAAPSSTAIFRRRDRQHRRLQRVSLDGRKFSRYDGPLTVADLPVDAHELIALCAPRPVFIGGGATKGDGWADAKGSFLAAVAAGPGLHATRQERLGHHRVPTHRNPADLRRFGFPPAHRRPHSRTQLAHISGISPAATCTRGNVAAGTIAKRS